MKIGEACERFMEIQVIFDVMNRKKLHQTGKARVFPRSASQSNRYLCYFQEHVDGEFTNIMKYIVNENRWKSVKSVQTRWNDYSSVCTDDAIIFIGGKVNQKCVICIYSSCLFYCNGYFQVWKINLTTDSYSLAPMNEASSNTAALVFDGFIYVFGGQNNEYKALNSVDR